MKSVAVFCGASDGSLPIYSEQAQNLGEKLASDGIRVIYGGAKIGIMGKVAEGALNAGGEVIGVIPSFLQTVEVAHDSLTEMFVVKTMHERKTKMNELSDGIIALPGGFGTMEEFFEILTWGQLGLHSKPMGLLNVNGFYDSLIAQFDVMVDSQLLKSVNREMVLVSDSINDLLVKMQKYKAPSVEKWITTQRT
ncbi:MAG: TIGR00730 family Rossman fold protein [Cyclobacteriaceae bacterium]